jgi:hypothetical protein
MANFTKGMIIPLEAFAEPVVFQWNPYEVHYDKVNKWAQLHPAGAERPIFHFGCGEARIISLSIEVSKHNNSDFFVKGWFDKLHKLTKPLVRGMGLNRPPEVQIILGGSLDAKAILKRVHFRMGSHRGQQHHFTYLAEPNMLLPKEGHVIIRAHELG